MKRLLLLGFVLLFVFWLLFILNTLRVDAQINVGRFSTTVYTDLDNDRQLDPLEQPTEGVTVTAHNLWTGETVTATTNSYGMAVFTDQPYGLWEVRYKCSSRQILVLEGSTTNVPFMVSNSCLYLPTINNNVIQAAEVQQTIIAIAIQDNNHNNIQDEGDARLPDVELTAENLTNGTIITGTTNTSGSIRWNNQPDGLWIVRHKCFRNQAIVIGVVVEMRIFISNGCQYLPLIYGEPDSIVIDNL
jgi:hypothetical protein